MSSQSQHQPQGGQDVYIIGSSHDNTGEAQVVMDRRGSNVQLQLNMSKIAMWEEVWLPSLDEKEELSENAWGPKGRAIIEKLRHKIDSQVAGIRNLEPHRAGKSRANAKKVGGLRKWLKALLQSRAQAHVQRNRQISTDVEQLSSSIDQLWEQSETIFGLLHGRQTGDVTTVETNLKTIRQSRQFSNALFFACQASGGFGIDLDLNLLNSDRNDEDGADLLNWTDLKLVHHFLVRSSDSQHGARDVFIESDKYCNFEWDSAGDETGNEQVDLKHISRIRSHTESMQRLSVPGQNATYQVYVRSSVTYECELQYPFASPQAIEAGNQESPVTESSSPTASNPPSPTAESSTSTLACSFNLSLLDKTWLAYRIAECGLFMLGTPWIWFFRSANIGCRLIGVQNEYYLRLHVPEEMYDTLQQYSEASQIKQLGMLLVEIALERTLQPDESIAGPIAEEIEQRMGLSYRQACEACMTYEHCQSPGRTASKVSLPTIDETRRPGLQENFSTTSVPDVAYETMIRHFYFGVYVRLRDAVQHL